MKFTEMTKSIYTKAWPGTIPDSDRLGSGGADDDGLWGGRVAAAGPAGGRAGGAQRGGRGQEAGQAVAGEPAQLCVYPAGRLHLPTVLDEEGSQEVELGGQGGQQQAAGVLYLQEGRG